LSPFGPAGPGVPWAPVGPCKPSATGSSVLSLGLQTSRTFTVADRVRHSTAALAAGRRRDACHDCAIHLHPIHGLLTVPGGPRAVPVPLAWRAVPRTPRARTPGCIRALGARGGGQLRDEVAVLRGARSRCAPRRTTRTGRCAWCRMGAPRPFARAERRHPPTW